MTGVCVSAGTDVLCIPALIGIAVRCAVFIAVAVGAVFAVVIGGES